MFHMDRNYRHNICSLYLAFILLYLNYRLHFYLHLATCLAFIMLIFILYHYTYTRTIVIHGMAFPSTLIPFLFQFLSYSSDFHNFKMLYFVLISLYPYTSYSIPDTCLYYIIFLYELSLQHTANLQSPTTKSSNANGSCMHLVLIYDVRRHLKRYNEFFPLQI